MSVSYDGTTQTSRMNATLTRIDNNASPAPVEICTAAYAAVLLNPLYTPHTPLGGPAVAGGTRGFDAGARELARKFLGFRE